jgi:hypothetical protein
MVEKADEELVQIAVADGPWINQDGVTKTLLDALLRAARISQSGQTPYRLSGPNDVEVQHEQMLRLWKRFGMFHGKENKPTTLRSSTA